MKQLTLSGAALVLCLAFAPPALAASIDDLAWMTGTWSGAVGPGVLEENWTVPRDGSIQSVVRMTGGGQTSMVELIVIEEEDDTLVLRLQQWDPGMKPRTEGPTVMKLAEMGESTIAFEVVGEGMFSTLRYTRDGDTFTISITNLDGSSFDLPLTAAR
ncbi:MAG: DUF6265 family protein [Gammaproteobacteria bacterium]|nr:DUF6265 family protein [Gammaproteobacteria bacterium]